MNIFALPHAPFTRLPCALLKALNMSDGNKILISWKSVLMLIFFVNVEMICRKASTEVRETGEKKENLLLPSIDLGFKSVSVYL